MEDNSQTEPVDVVIAGHICIDVIPAFLHGANGGPLFQPGSLFEVGPPTLSTGGAVSNTGLALDRLGVPVRLVGKIGNDHLGGVLLDLLRDRNPKLATGMRVVAGEVTSYSIVLSPNDQDRMFLHHTGANDTFEAGDVSSDLFSDARMLHFGYPPIMKRICMDGGVGLATILSRARAAGLTTSLDMAQPDPLADAGRVDWVAYLQRVLPQVDLFIPSIDEMRYMLRDRPLGMDGPLGGAMLSRVSEFLIAGGVGVVALKLGDQGLYIRTSDSVERWNQMGKAAPADKSVWIGRELLLPCFAVDVVGTTGSGDCTVAGFLAGFLQGGAPEAVGTVAVGVGAFNVESQDATSGIPHWNELMERIDAGWPQRQIELELPGWTADTTTGILSGPHDRKARPAR